MTGRLACCLLVALAWILCVLLKDVAAVNFTSLALSPTLTLSGHQVRTSTGNCARVYLDRPEQFCSNWLEATVVAIFSSLSAT